MLNNKIKNIFKQTVILFLITAFSIFAQKRDYSNEPGYVNFGNFDEFEQGDEVAEVVIEQHLLKMVAKLAGNKDKEMSSVLSGLKLIKINSFEVTHKNRSKILAIIKSVDKKLIDKNWDRIIRVKKKNEVANVYIKTIDDDKIEGLVVTNIDYDGEASFVNIVGNINLNSIGRLSEKFNIPEIGKISKGDKDNEKHSDKDE